MAYLGQSFSQGPARVNPAVLYFDAANLLFFTDRSVDGQFQKARVVLLYQLQSALEIAGVERLVKGCLSAEAASAAWCHERSRESAILSVPYKNNSGSGMNPE